jgi:hypothetical protein
VLSTPEGRLNSRRLHKSIYNLLFIRDLEFLLMPVCRTVTKFHRNKSTNGTANRNDLAREAPRARGYDPKSDSFIRYAQLKSPPVECGPHVSHNKHNLFVRKLNCFLPTGSLPSILGLYLNLAIR